MHDATCASFRHCPTLTLSLNTDQTTTFRLFVRGTQLWPAGSQVPGFQDPGLPASTRLRRPKETQQSQEIAASRHYVLESGQA